MNEELIKLFGEKKIPLKIMLKRVFKYLKPELFNFILAGFLLVLNVALDIVSPLFISNIIKNLKSDNINLTFIISLSVLYLVIIIFNQVFLYFESIILQKAGQNIIYRLRVELFEHITNMSLDQHNLMPVGSLVTRVTSYTTSVSELFTSVIVNVFRNIISIVGVAIIMIFISPLLTLVLSSLLIVIFISSFVFERVVGKIFRNERRYVSDLNTFLNENLQGMKIIQIFNQEKRKKLEFILKNENLRKARYNVTIAFAIYRPFITFIYIASNALIFYMGIKLNLSPDMIVAFYLYISKLFNPIQNLADQLNQIQNAFTACERIFNLLDVPPQVKDKEGAIELNDVKGKIEFRNVWFAYNDEDWILKDVSFVCNAGESCAFVGATGAGKTTILSLIVRNYEIQKGQILIDDIDIRDIKITSLRKNIGQMLQDVFLFSGSIKDNITLGDESFDDQKIDEVCKYVNCDTFINKLEYHYDEEVLEKGENFSLGERQLLSFARTVLHEPKILILDEATSSIDTESEKIIQNSLEKMRDIGTMLIVAHRLSTIQHSNQIIVLKKGEVIEKGTHQQLLKNKGHYYKLYQLQFENS